MGGYLSLLREQAVSRGWPGQLFDSITKLFGGDDIVGVGTRLAVIGVLASVVTTLFYYVYERGENALFPTAFIEGSDPAFEWIGIYLSQDPSVVKQMQSFRLITSDERDSRKADVWRHSKKERARGLALSKRDATWTADSVVGQLVPVNGQAVKIFFAGRPPWVTRRSRSFERDPDSYARHLQIRSYAWTADAIKDLVLASHKLFYHKGADELMIHHASPWNGTWVAPITRPARAWSSVFLPRHIKEDLLEDVRGFLSDEEKKWYAARGIPHRRGYLLHGPPGSGKTTLATAIASHLRLDLYCLNPATRGMDDNKVQTLFRDVPSGSLILIEDMPRGMIGTGSDEDDDPAMVVPKAEGDPGRYGLPPSSVTLSGLLNAIDGEDSVLLASTNHPERLDDALKRPGRFAVHVRFENAEPDQVIALFKHFYPCHTNSTGAAQDGGKPKPALKLGGHVFDNQDPQSILASKLSKTVSESGAAVSMAALQGHLLKHKKDPAQAVTSAVAWANELYREQEEKRQKKAARKQDRDGRKANGNGHQVLTT